MKLESLESDLFTPLGRAESARVIGGSIPDPETGMQQPLPPGATSSTFWINTFFAGTYIGMDRETLPD